MGNLRRVCLAPAVKGVGGMVSFARKLSAGLAARQVEVCSNPDDLPYDALLLIGGTRHLQGLWRARRRGVPVVQRLDGMNWLHRLPPRPGKPRPSLRHFLRAEYGNWLLALIRARLATRIIYQSEFSARWWEHRHGPAPVPSRVIYNGVDLAVYTPQGPGSPPANCWRVLLVEGSLQGGYELGLGVAVQLVEQLRAVHSAELARPVELVVAGSVPAVLQQAWQGRTAIPLRWAGLLPGEQIPTVDRSAHLLYSADINAACPNSVIEGLACGLPVLAFDTGALPELVSNGAGRIVPYGGDPWRLDPPDLAALAHAAVDIMLHQELYRPAARSRAEAVFGLDAMVQTYLEELARPA